MTDYHTAKSYAEAYAAYTTWKSKDPFSKIPAALLNSADILDYVRMTGMIYPFYPDDLRGATYTVRLKGMCVYFSEDKGGEPIRNIFCIGSDPSDLPNAESNKKAYEVRETLILPPNSITFVTLEPTFQVPDYLVFRFNLKIPHVYKGLLLGTGPIIDPGFQGRLSIPLHNLTSNEYVFHQGDEIISLEITKMSPYKTWDCYDVYPRQGEYIPTKITPNRQADYYIHTALMQTNKTSIVSSVVSATNEAKGKAESAEATANKVKEYAETTASDVKGSVDKLDNKIEKYTLIGALAVLISVVALFATLVIPTYQLIKATSDTQAEYAAQIQELEQKVSRLETILKNNRRTEWIP